MAKKEPRYLNKLPEFIDWVSQVRRGKYLFRGVSDEAYPIEPSTYRRLPAAEKTPETLLNINKEYLRDARLRGHGTKNGRDLSDLELLAELQHFGAATLLIDFTFSAQVALWFACQQSAKGPSNGKVSIVRVVDVANPDRHAGDANRCSEITPELLAKPIASFFEPDADGETRLYRWQPAQQNSRILAQDSVFLFGGAEIETAAECVIPERSKTELLISLYDTAGITEARMFPDFDGFARQRAHNKPHGDAFDYMQRGFDAHAAGRLEAAVDYVSQVLSLRPSNFLQHLAYSFRAEVHLDKDELELAIQDYGKAISAMPEPEFTRLPYYERGIVWLYLRKWDNAQADLETARQQGLDISSWFHDEFGSVLDFEAEQIGEKLPEDIAEILTAA